MQARSSSPWACLPRPSRPRARIAPPAERRLLALLARNCGELRWGQTYTAADFGQSFIDNYGWMELFGTRGHFVNDIIAAGFLILGPGSSIRTIITLPKSSTCR